MASSKKIGPSKSNPGELTSADANIEEPGIEEAVSVEDNKTPDADGVASDQVTPTDEQPVDQTEAAQENPGQTPDNDEDLSGDESETPQIEPDTSPTEPETDAGTTTAEMVHPVPMKAPVPEKKGSVFLPLVLGGIIAGGIGFFLAQSDIIKKPDDAAITQLRSDLIAQQARIAALETAEPAVVEAAPTEVPTVDLSPIEEQIDGLQARLTALEERPSPPPSEGVSVQAVQSYAAELEELKGAVQTQRGEIEALIRTAKTVEQATEEAAKAARAQAAIARAQASLARVVSAIDAGRPFADALAELQALDLGDLDPVLISAAPDGVATLGTLQTAFPDQARSALSAARASGADGGQQGIGNFLMRSLGARSVAPREGDDPDSVLSRAEAAINSGDLSAALAELDTLPEVAQSAVSDWRAAAEARVAARMAADALSQRLAAD